MAFQQPARAAVARQPRAASQERSSSGVGDSGTGPTAGVSARHAHAHAHGGDVHAPATWVLFSPAADTATTVTTASQSSSSVLASLAASSQETAGRSRLSEEAVMSDSDDGDDDAELDSLDSHLADFTAQQTSQTHHTNQTNIASSTVNLPTHDGLGSFRFGFGLANAFGPQAGPSAQTLQEQLYAFEQFNPRRVAKRRRSSLERALDMGAFAPESEFLEDLERTRRIEAWRWEHSRVLLEEIQRETRRRRNSELSRRRGSTASAPKPSLTTAAAAAAAAALDETAVTEAEAGGAWHEQEDDDGLSRFRRDDTKETDTNETDDDDEGVLSRLTRRFMQDVMGIDDRILSVLFGETLPDEAMEAAVRAAVPVAADDDLSSTPRASDPFLGMDMHDEQGTADAPWQLRMLERIARELGAFVHTMGASHHPGAFSTFARVQQMPLPYAGLPVIPEVAASTASAASLQRSEAADSSRYAADSSRYAADSSRYASDVAPTGTTASLPRFRPTVAMPVAIPVALAMPETHETHEAGKVPEAPTPKADFTQDEWEQDLDIKLVFRYLRSRFFSENRTHGHTHGHGHTHRHAMSVQEAAAKVARVRQHHPLVANRKERVDRVERLERKPALVPVRAPSCASQSTRRSRSSRHGGSSRPSSRHYWDLGGSIGTGSLASVGPMGSWGEV